MAKNAKQLDRRLLESLPHIRQLVFREQVKSTNDLALELAKAAKLEFPALIVAERQTDGRGQPGRRWLSAAGSLTCSLAVNFRAEIPPMLPLAVGLAVADAIEDSANNPAFQSTAEVPHSMLAPQAIRLKWPNDLRVNQKKLGGILVETLAAESVAVIGIGLNVNNEIDSSADAAPSFPATNLASLAGTPLDLTHLLIALSRSVVKICDSAERPGDRESIRTAIEKRLEFSQTSIQFELPGGERIEVRLLGLDPSGGLVVERDGRRVTLVSGSIVV